MKVYVIKKGTKVILKSEKSGKVMEYRTQKEISFSDYILDPIRLHNATLNNKNGLHELEKQFVNYAKNGNAIYDLNQEFPNLSWRYLIVPYNNVEVLC